MLFAAFALCCDVNLLTLYVHIGQFLSMKLSAVNPALDFNIERILSKDVCNPLPDLYSSLLFFIFLMLIYVSYIQLFQSQGTASSTFGFLPDIGHQFLHPPKHSQAALHSIVNPADAFGRVTNAPVGCTFKEAAHQVCLITYCAYVSHLKPFRANARLMDINRKGQYLVDSNRPTTVLYCVVVHALLVHYNFY